MWSFYQLPLPHHKHLKEHEHAGTLQPRDQTADLGRAHLSGRSELTLSRDCSGILTRGLVRALADVLQMQFQSFFLTSAVAPPIAAFFFDSDDGNFATLTDTGRYSETEFARCIKEWRAGQLSASALMQTVIDGVGAIAGT